MDDKQIFEAMLDIMYIELIKTDNGYRLYDNQRQIDYDKDHLEYRYVDLYQVIERLDDLIYNYFAEELINDFDIEDWSNYEDILNQIGDRYKNNRLDGCYDIDIFVLKFITTTANYNLDKFMEQKGE